MITIHSSGLRSRLPARGHRSVAVALVATVVLMGCGRSGGDDVAEPSVEPGQPIDVSGRAQLRLDDLSTHKTLVFPLGTAGDVRVPADQSALEDAANAVRDWLNSVLSERNRGLTTTAQQSGVDMTAFRAALGVDGVVTDGVLETQVARAEYIIQIGYLGQPGWSYARVQSTLVASDDPATEIGQRIDTFVFTIDEDGALEFVALEVAP